MTIYEKFAKQLQKLTKKVNSLKEVLVSSVALSGVVQGCYILGLNQTTGDLYYRDSNDEWQLLSSGGGGDFIITARFSSIIGEGYTSENTSNPVTGLDDASAVIQSDDFAGAVVLVMIGGNPIMPIDTGTSDTFMTKSLASDTITLSNPLVDGDAVDILVFGPGNGSGGGGIQSIVAGTDIDVDDTDPLNPIVSYIGSATTPTWQETLTESSNLTSNVAITSNNAVSYSKVLSNAASGNTTITMSGAFGFLFRTLDTSSNVLSNLFGGKNNFSLFIGNNTGAIDGLYGSIGSLDLTSQNAANTEFNSIRISRVGINSIWFSHETGNYFFPRTTPTIGQVLTATNGLGQLGWVNPAGGGGNQDLASVLGEGFINGGIAIQASGISETLFNNSNGDPILSVGADDELFLSDETGVRTLSVFNNSVGIGIDNADNSAILDLTSTTKGFLIPRMTQAQKNAIVTPATGLFVYQTDNTDGFYYYDGSTWNFLSVAGNTLYSSDGALSGDRVVTIPSSSSLKITGSDKPGGLFISDNLGLVSLGDYDNLLSGTMLNIDMTGGENAILVNADFEISTGGKGIIIKSPDSTRYKIVVDNAGVLSTVAA